MPSYVLVLMCLYVVANSVFMYITTKRQDLLVSQINTLESQKHDILSILKDIVGIIETTEFRHVVKELNGKSQDV